MRQTSGRVANILPNERASGLGAADGTCRVGCSFEERLGLLRGKGPLKRRKEEFWCQELAFAVVVWCPPPTCLLPCGRWRFRQTHLVMALQIGGASHNGIANDCVLDPVDPEWKNPRRPWIRRQDNG